MKAAKGAPTQELLSNIELYLQKTQQLKNSHELHLWTLEKVLENSFQTVNNAIPAYLKELIELNLYKHYNEYHSNSFRRKLIAVTEQMYKSKYMIVSNQFFELLLELQLNWLQKHTNEPPDFEFDGEVSTLDTDILSKMQNKHFEISAFNHHL